MVWKTAEGFVQGCAAPTCDLVEVSSSKEPMVPVQRTSTAVLATSGSRPDE